MRSKFLLIFGLITLALLLMVLPVLAQQGSGNSLPREDDQFEQEIYRQIIIIDPAALPVFQEATRAMDSKEYERAETLYITFLQMIPDFPPALRRLSYVETYLNKPQMALQHAQRAVALENTAYNRTALAAAYLSTGQPEDLGKALALAKQAAIELPDSGYTNIVLLDVAAKAVDHEGMRTASQNLIRISPEVALPHYFAGVVAANDGYWEEAEEELLLSQELGMPAEQVQETLDELDVLKQAQLVRQKRWLKWGLYVIAGIVLLVGLGFFARKYIIRHDPA